MFIDWIAAAGDLLWGPWTFFALLGTGVLFTVWTGFLQWRALTHGFAVLLGRYDRPDDPGAISHFQALSAALSGTVGLGNIGGVALAISIGGPGALFWMWVVAFLGMAIKAVEVTMALMFRNVDDPRKPSGGAMWVIERTLGARGGTSARVARLLGTIFCATMLVSTITGGNIFQAWNVAELTQTYAGVPQWMTCAVLTAIVALVILGGIRRIGTVAATLVPLMVVLYVAACLVVVLMNVTLVPEVLGMVVRDAFSPSDAGGAFLGAGAWFGFRIGLQRALFSNEAGQGSAPIAHAAAQTSEPAREGFVGGVEPFIDTIVICTLTALVILVTGTWNRESPGEINVPVEIAATSDAEWTVVSEVRIGDLPTLPSPHRWNVGDQLSVRLRVTDAAGTVLANPANGQQRVAIMGEVVSADAPLRWRTVTIDAGEWNEGAPVQVALESAEIHRSLEGATLTAMAFDRVVPGFGMLLITVASWLFAVSTMISWYYYGEQGTVYLVGERGVGFYKLVFLVAALSGPLAARNVDALLAVIDFGTGAMLWGNLPILLFAGGLAVAELRRYDRRLRAGEFTPRSADGSSKG